MRISIVFGFFLPVPPLRGGATEKIWHRLARQFAEEGHAVNLVSRRWPGLPERETREGVAYFRPPGAGHTRHLAWNLVQDLRWGIRAARALPPADVLISHCVSLPAWLPRINPRAGRVVAVLGRMPKGQVRLYGAVDRVYATSAAVAERAAAERPALAPRIKVIGNPIDWELLSAAPGARGPAGPTAPVELAYIGRLHPEKGTELLLQAARRLAADPTLPPWRLSLIGPLAVPDGGGGEPWLGRLLAAHGPALGGRVAVLPPEFDPARLALRYGSADIFCYPSLAESGETFGVAAAEAMAAGCAPVVSALACFRDLVRAGETGVVFDHRAPEPAAALARALAELIRNEPARRRLADQAREFVRRYDYPRVGANILADLAQLS